MLKDRIDARTFGDYYQSTEVKNDRGETLFLIEGPTENGVTIDGIGSMEVIDNNGNWDGAKFVHNEQLTGERQWMRDNLQSSKNHALMLKVE